MKKSLALSGNDLTLGQLYEVVLEGFEVTLAPEARARMDASQAVVERLSRGDVAAYGINTGFGALATVRIHRNRFASCN